jgi:hypothetical protein
VIDVDALRGVITALRRLADQNPDLADQARQTWTSAFTGMRASDTPERVSDNVLLSRLDNAWALLAGSLTPNESALLIEAFEDFGWRIPTTRPQDQPTGTELRATSQSGVDSDNAATNHIDHTPGGERSADPPGNRPADHWFTLELPFPANPDIRLGICLVRNSAAPRPTVTIEELNLLQTIYHRVQETLAPPDQANDTDISPGHPQ